MRRVTKRAGQRPAERRSRRVLNAAIEGLEPRRLMTAVLGWDVSGQTAFGPSPLAANTVDGGVTNSTGLTRVGAGASGMAAGRAWGGVAWTSADASGAVYATFGLTVKPGKSLSLSSI